MHSRKYYYINMISLVFISSALAAEPDREVLKAQGALTRALNEQVKAMVSADGAKTAATKASIGVAQDRLSQAVHRKHEEEKSLIYNKAYLPDGQVQNASDLHEESLVEIDTTNDPDTDPDVEGAPESEGTQGGRALTSGSGSFTGGSKSVRQNGSDRPEWVLDGSAVPKELVFPGNPKAPPKNAKNR
ncbi:MAG: hypothetical protein NDJ89_16245 [Oligoflexia bacterium]|nr:hypothetical protein [Oligoflexia bacterium]